MRFRSIELRAIGAIVCLALLGVNAHAQKRRKARPPAPPAFVSSASHVAAELTKGTLKPTETQPGDEFSVLLKDDVKSNGDVVLKKGTTITGVVRNVKSAETKGLAQSIMQIEWLAPPLQGKTARQLSIALQSITKMNPISSQKQSEKVEKVAFTDITAARSVAAPQRIPAASNAAMLNMPSVIPVDTKTASSLESNFGASSSEKLFKVGRSEWITAGGTKQSVELFSHLSNDTMITSPSKDFEVSRGAQMQLLVGVSKQ